MPPGDFPTPAGMEILDPIAFLGHMLARSQDFLGSAVPQRALLPEPQNYRGFGFKLSVSSMFSLFHYLCLKGLQKHPCFDGWKPALHVFISSSCGVDLCQVSPST